MPTTPAPRPMKATAYARRMQSWGGPPPVCHQCALPILPGELAHWIESHRSRHTNGEQCQAARRFAEATA